MDIRPVKTVCAVLFPSTATQNVADLFQPLLFADSTYLLPYGNIAVQKNIKTNKYQRDPEAAAALAVVLDRYLHRHPNASIVPMPQSYTRWRERGFDHLTEIIQHSSHRDALRTDILHKTMHTQRQAHVSKDVRRRQQAGTFACRPAAATLSDTVILFDDVITTGATMHAARAALAPHLSPDTRLVCLALAH